MYETVVPAWSKCDKWCWHGAVGGWETWWTQLPWCTWLTTGLIWATTPWVISDSGSARPASQSIHRWNTTLTIYVHFYGGHLQTNSKLYPNYCINYFSSFPTVPVSSTSASWSLSQLSLGKNGLHSGPLLLQVLSKTTSKLWVHSQFTLCNSPKSVKYVRYSQVLSHISWRSSLLSQGESGVSPKPSHHQFSAEQHRDTDRHWH